MKPLRALAWTAGALVIVLGAALTVGELTGWRALRTPLQNTLQRAAGVPVQLEGSFAARLLWRPQLQAQHVNVGAAGGVAAPHLIDGRGITLQWRWMDLWRWRQGGPLRLQSLQAEALDVQLLRLADGRATWQLGTKRTEPSTDTDNSGSLPRIGLFDVRDGRIEVDDKITDTQLHIALQGREASGGSGSYRVTATGRYRAAPLRLQLQSDSALPLFETESAGPARSSAVHLQGEVGDARISFDGNASALRSAMRLDGALRLAGPSLAAVGGPLGVTLPQTPAFELNGRLSHDDGVWQLVAERANIGASRLAGDFRYDTRTSPPRLTGRLGGLRLLLADLGPAIGAPTGGTAAKPVTTRPAQQQTGRVLPQRRLDMPSLRGMDADVQVAIDELVFGTDALTPMRNLRTHVQLSQGVLQLRELQAGVAGGHARGTMRLDSNTKPPQWTTQLRIGDVDIAGWLRGARTPAGREREPAQADAKQLKQQRKQALQQPDTPPPAYVTGVIEADIDVVGVGTSTADALGSLRGRIDATLRDGTLSHLITEAVGLDLAQALGVAVRGDRPLPLRCARMTMTVKDGVATVQRGVTDNEDSTIRIGGQVDLQHEQLALVARSRPKDISPLSLRSPITVTGPLDRPQVGIQGRRMAGRVLGAVALGSVFPPLALLPLFDRGERETEDPCAGEATAEAAAAASAPARKQAAR